MSEATQELADKKCVPCTGGVDPLKGEELRGLADQLSDEWEVVDEHHLVREYEFDDFVGALEFTNRIGELAEEQGHHPEIHLGWGHVELEVWTHKIDGLTESDFVWAAKAERIFEERD